MAAKDDDALWGIEELAAYIGKSVRAIYSLRHRGDCPPAILIGKTIKWRRSDVEAWIESKVESAK